ncbi:MAG: hypothetical protein ABDH59_02780 [Fervidobacterium sp.]
MELGLKEWIVMFLAGIFLFVFLFDVEEGKSQKNLDEKKLVQHEIQAVKQFKISCMKLNLKLDIEEERIYMNPELTFENDKTQAIISGISGNIILAGKEIKSLTISCVSADISGKSTVEVIYISCTNVNFNNFFIETGGNVKISAAAIQGSIYISNEVNEDLYFDISAASSDLVIFVSQSVKDKIRFTGIVPKVVIK